MKKLALCILAALFLQACVVRLPSISSSVIEADEKNGNLISIDGSFCGAWCEKYAMDKAQEVCPTGYAIKNSSRNDINHIHMVVRCQK
ncbi:hypothetical protein H9Q10_05270 [Eikenella sp. S3360]|uniref:Lipoprotein n=1 Tax=Eikenella glucosivorans TaxID=2766967 RepID=A0ABS0N9U4_9NEIS|nr:hypothetical protein [Eikenella glucosivorans]MBH5329077.1 hypothetical protein [Eikenella glucosivorans]